MNTRTEPRPTRTGRISPTLTGLRSHPQSSFLVLNGDGGRTRGAIWYPTLSIPLLSNVRPCYRLEKPWKTRSGRAQSEVGRDVLSVRCVGLKVHRMSLLGWTPDTQESRQRRAWHQGSPFRVRQRWKQLWACDKICAGPGGS